MSSNENSFLRRLPSDDEEDHDEDDDSIEHGAPVDSSTDRKKQVHLRCEQMRREAIKNGYVELKELLPSDFAPLGFKMTNASILFRAADYLKKLQQQHDTQEEEVNKLKSQLVALQIICQNYEQIALQQEQSTAQGGDQSLSTMKFNMFKKLMEHLYQSFETKVSSDDYASLTKSLLSWLEQQVNFQSVPEILSQSITTKSPQ